jgi:hypothetical protein
MRILAFAAVSALALGAAACAPRVDYAHRTALDCPERQGELQRTGVSPDRKSCTYRASEGAEVTLQLTPVANGDAGATLEAIEASLTGPSAPGAAVKSDAAEAKADEAKADEAKADGAAKTADAAKAGKTPATAPAAASGSDAERAAREAAEDARAGAKTGSDTAWNSDDDHVVVGRNRHGEVRVHDNAHVSLPGLHIDADDDNARVDIAGVHIDANDSEATVHVVRDVRLRGEAFSREKRGLRAFFIAKRDNLPDGYRFVGYQASGPKAGPLTVAVVRSRDEIDHGDHLYRDIQRLVRMNGGA